MIYEFFAYTERTMFTVEAANEAEARAKLAEAPHAYLSGGYSLSLTEDDFDLNDEYASADCEAGLHSWIDETGDIAPDERCAHCGETYGEVAA